MKAARKLTENKLEKAVPAPLPEELVLYHSYVLTNNFKISFPVIDSHTIITVKDYFLNQWIVWPWHCKQIIDYCRDNTAQNIKKEAKRMFPDMFTWGSGPNPVDIPESVKDWNTMELALLEKHVSNFKSIQREKQKEKIMSDEMNSQVEESVSQPVNIDETLTLENYKERTGKRFRLTKAEKALVDSNEATREEIFIRRRDSGQLEA